MRLLNTVSLVKKNREKKAEFFYLKKNMTKLLFFVFFLLPKQFFCFNVLRLAFSFLNDGRAQNNFLKSPGRFKMARNQLSVFAKNIVLVVYVKTNTLLDNKALLLLANMSVFFFCFDSNFTPLLLLRLSVPASFLFDLLKNKKTRLLLSLRNKRIHTIFFLSNYVLKKKKLTLAGVFTYYLTYLLFLQTLRSFFYYYYFSLMAQWRECTAATFFFF